MFVLMKTKIEELKEKAKTTIIGKILGEKDDKKIEPYNGENAHYSSSDEEYAEFLKNLNIITADTKDDKDVFSVESRTLILYIPEPVGPGSLQYSTECIADDGVARRLKYYNGILYVQKKNDGGDYENDTLYNEDFKNMKLASVYQ